MYREWKKTEFPKELYMNLETRPRGRPRNRWQDEVREEVRTVGREEWLEKVYNREEWKKLLRTARNCHILHMPMERMNTPCNMFHITSYLPTIYVQFPKTNHFFLTPTCFSTGLCHLRGILDCFFWQHIKMMQKLRVYVRILMLDGVFYVVYCTILMCLPLTISLQ
jgi:hypothetical protein